ncbi:MAG: hypothetical protein ACOVNU_06800 [Candidatus Kapaibacteriota bacterium]|jgi:hypothetical protein
MLKSFKPNISNILHILVITLLLSLNSCMPPGFEHTRIEEDNHRIIEQDTSYTFFEQNNPENKDRGIIHPSTKVINTDRTYVSFDSSVTREYPDFIRAGFFETSGLITGMSNPIALGVLGVHPSLPSELKDYRGESGSRLFSGGLYRAFFYEKRLRWFRDSKNWTWGLSMFEAIVPNGEFEQTLMSVLPLYIRKRYFIREEIPYICYTPTLGIAYNPLLSLYLNPSVSLDAGSIGGFNIRAYLGVAIGFNGSTTPMIKRNENVTGATTPIIPYGGIGVSVLDFLNLVPETYEEWTDMPHSAWNIGIVQANILYTDSDKSFFQDPTSTTNLPIKGLQFKFINTSVALPVLDYKLYVGTSLINIMYLGDLSIGAGILPIRVGYWHTLLEDELSLEPFIEYNYYPSSIFNVGARLNLKLNDRQNISLTAGYASGSVINEQTFSGLTEFSNLYIGIGINLWDMIFYQQDLRYYKDYEAKNK